MNESNEITGQHALPPPPSLAHLGGIPQPPATGYPQPPNGWRRDVMTFILAALVGGGGGFASSQIDRAAEDARTSSRLGELERRVGVAEGRLEGVEAVRRDIARLEATVGAQTAGIDRRLGRIEDRLDRASGSR